MIKFRCHSCNQKIGTPDDYAGKKAKCPKCHGVLTVPQGTASEIRGKVDHADSPIQQENPQDLSVARKRIERTTNGSGKATRKDSVVYARCSSCGKNMGIPQSLGGTTLLCPDCELDAHLAQVAQHEAGAESTYELEQLTKECPYCGEEILEKAKKCKHCGEFLNDASVGSYSSGFAAQPAVTRQMPYAGFWLRVLASLIDCPVYFVIYLLSSFLVGFIMGSIVGTPDMWTDAEFTIIAILTNITIYVAQFLYKATMESSGKQGTLGKMALGLRVVDMDGNKISFARATGRYWLSFVMAIIPILNFIAYIMAGFTERKQTLYDKICSTTVIKKQ